MLVAINTKYRYYKERDENKLSKDWIVVDYNYKQLIEHLMSGYPITNIYTTGVKNFRRKAKHFTSASFIPLDFDNDPNELFKYYAKEFTVRELTTGFSDRAKFIKENAYIGYLTYNHTNEPNRFRIIFKLPKPIIDINEYIKVYKAFLDKFPSADHNYVISTGFVWGAKKGTLPLKLGNNLSEKTLKAVLEYTQKLSKSIIIKSNNKSFIEDKLLCGKQVETEINKYLTELKQAKHNNRMITLNKVCYSIGGLIAVFELSQAVEETIKAEIRKMAYELGSITNYESFTKNNINIAINKSINEGKKKPLNYEDIRNTKYRLFNNLPKKGYFQFPQQISTDYPSPEYISEIPNQKIEEAVTMQIAYFGKFLISNDEIIDETFIFDIFDVLKNNEALKSYLALWEYANIKNTLSFKDIEINEIIKLAYPDLNKQEMYRHRKKFKNYIKKLFTITLFRKTKINNTELEEGIHLIDKLLFITKRHHHLISYTLPETFGKFGSYLPYSLKKLTGNEKGASNLVIALFKEAFRINGFERIKKDSGDFTPPENIKPIKWSKERVLKETRTITTKNVTERSKLLNNTLTKLKRINIIDRYTMLNNEVYIYLKE